MFSNPYPQRPWYARSRFVRLRIRARWTPLFALALAVLVLPGCEVSYELKTPGGIRTGVIGGSDAPAASAEAATTADDVRGLWLSTGDDAYAYHVTAATVEVYDYQADAVDAGDTCYERYDFPVLGREGTAYTVTGMSGSPIAFLLERSGQVLLATAPDGTGQPMRQSDVPLTALLPECP